MTNTMHMRGGFHRSGPRRQNGFTLVEAIMVIVVTGIVVAMVAMFIKLPVDNYADTLARTAATDIADYALRRVARDVRLALPNSVRVDATGKFIEFLQTTGGQRYLAEDDVHPTPADPHLSWNDASLREFTVVGGVATDRNRPLANQFVVVYNLGAGQEPGDAYGNCALGCNRALIESVGANTITLASNPFAAQATLAGVALMSPGKRFHVVSSAVTYACVNDRLMRYWNYTIAPVQPVPPTDGLSALMSDKMDCTSTSFTYANLANQRSGLVGMTFGLAVSGSGGTAVVKMLNQVHVDNTP